MNVTLREGDLDAEGLEPLPHLQQTIAFHVGDAVHRRNNKLSMGSSNRRGHPARDDSTAWAATKQIRWL